MSVYLKRLKSYKDWKENKILVIHMITPMLDVETCLNMSKIPFEAISIESNNFELEIRKNIKESSGIIITGSRKKGDLLPGLPDIVTEVGLPILGICYGNEWLCQILDGSLIECNPPIGEHSEVECILGDSLLFKGIKDKEQIVTMAHDYMISELPIGSKSIASTDLTPISGFELLSKKMFGLQFHPEKGYLGELIFSNFFKYCTTSR